MGQEHRLRQTGGQSDAVEDLRRSLAGVHDEDPAAGDDGQAGAGARGVGERGSGTADHGVQPVGQLFDQIGRHRLVGDAGRDSQRYFAARQVEPADDGHEARAAYQPSQTPRPISRHYALQKYIGMKGAILLSRTSNCIALTCASGYPREDDREPGR